MESFEVAVEDTAVVARHGDRVVRLPTTGWSPTDDAPAVGDVPLDETRAGRVTGLRLPDVSPQVAALDRDVGDDVEQFDADAAGTGYDMSTSGSLPPAEYRLYFSSERIRVYLRFDAAGVVECARDGDHDGWTVRFGRPTAVRVGVRSMVDRPGETVRVPATVEGLARAVSTFRTGLRTTGPDRSWPTYRTHPPRVEFTDGAVDLAGLPAAGPHTGVTLAVPRQASTLLAAAPLVYYLGATVTVETRDRPVLRAPTADYRRSFSAGPAHQREFARLLYRTHRLDYLVRAAGPHGSDGKEERLLADRGIDPGAALDREACYEAGVAERLARYAAVDADVLSVFPAWSRATVLPPEVRAGRALPYLSVAPEAVYTPRAVEGVERSAPWAGSPPLAGDEALVWPRPGPEGERLLCWAADGTVDDRGPGWFAATPGDRVRDRPENTGTVEVLVAAGDGVDPAAVEEYVAARGAETGLSTAVHRAGATATDQKRATGEPVDVLVYAGETPPGDALEGGVDAEIAVVSAPGARAAARGLVDGGVAAAVAVEAGPAAETGLVAAGLLCHGATAADAAWLAPRVGADSANVTAIGDGTRTLPGVGLGLFVCENDDTGATGHTYPNVEGGVGSLFDGVGRESEAGLFGLVLERSFQTDLQTELDEQDMPVVHDGDLYWPSEHAALLNPVV